MYCWDGYIQGVDNEKAKEHLNLALVYAKTETERIGIRKELRKV